MRGLNLAGLVQSIRSLHFNVDETGLFYGCLLSCLVDSLVRSIEESNKD